MTLSMAQRSPIDQRPERAGLDAQRAHWYERRVYRSESIAETLQRAIERRPEAALHFHTAEGLRSTTVAEIWQAAGRVGAGLVARGLRTGDVFALQLPSSFETAVLYVAVLRAGAVLLPIVHSYAAAELDFLLQDAGARWLALRDVWYGVDQIERASAARAFASVEGLVVVGERAPTGALRLRELLATATDAPDPSVGAPDADAVCTLLYTSGTTSQPKGVRHTHNTLRSEWEIPFLETDGAFLNPFPAGHIAGFNFLLRPFMTGVPVVFLDRWDPAIAAQLGARFRVTQSGGTPYFFNTLVEAARTGGHDLSSIRAYSLGATGVTPELVRAADALGWRAGRSYGLTEHSTVTRCDPASSLEQRMHTDGRLQPLTEVRIVDAEGRELSAGSDGEILTRGPELFAGYTNPAANAEAFTPDGWFRTGDIGRLDAEGFLTITDRLKDIIIRGGEKISSREIEEVLLRHAAVREVAVIALPDERYGEQVCAIVVPQREAAPTLETLVAHCTSAGLARFKAPARLEIRADLPRTASGKIRKQALRREIAPSGLSRRA